MICILVKKCAPRLPNFEFQTGLARIVKNIQGLLRPRSRLLCFYLKNANFLFSLILIIKSALKKIFITENISIWDFYIYIYI